VREITITGFPWVQILKEEDCQGGSSFEGRCFDDTPAEMTRFAAEECAVLSMHRRTKRLTPLSWWFSAGFESECSTELLHCVFLHSTASKAGEEGTLVSHAG
jgi:hypothetical protein